MQDFYSATDRELLNLIAGGDQKAFNRLFDQYRDQLFHYLQKITKSNETAEEIVLDVFVKIWTGRSILTEIDNFEAFIFQVAKNKGLDFLRQAQRSKLRQTALWNCIQASVRLESADEKVLLEEIAQTVQQAVDRLSPQRKKVYQLSREQGFTYEQIGKRLHLSTHTVRNHLAASLQIIRSHLGTDWVVALLAALMGIHR
jgi:RNA polymerase sigma-70 factor (ECF subfamily)